jgi:hypothetical protein
MFERPLTTQDLFWILPLTAVAIAVFILALRMCYDTFIKPKPPKPLRYQSTINQYRRIPQVGDKPTFSKTDVTQYCIGFILFLLVAASCSPKGTLNCGSRYKLIAPSFNK